MSAHAQSRQTTRCYPRDSNHSNRRKVVQALDLNALPPEAFLPDGIAASVDPPIDIEAIDEEVMLLPSSSVFPQARNRLRQRHFVVDVDNGQEIHAVRPVSINNHKRRERIPENKMIIDCDVYPTFKDDRNAKRNKVMDPCPEPVKEVPKEPIFSCPVCMHELSEACSTICGHVFCQVCIKLSIQKQKRCPTCRRSLTMKNFHRVYLPTSN